MKETLKPRCTRTGRFVVDRARTIGFMGEALRVYATPELVRDIETTCRALLLEHSDPGEDSVGINVELAHSAATPLGMEASITVTVAAIEGRRVSFDVAARDAVEEIGHGRHTRFVVDVEKTRERLAAKAAKAVAK